MRVFDLHCDTLYECALKGYGLYHNSLAVSLDKGLAFDEWVQTFAIFMPDDKRGQAAMLHFDRVYRFFAAQLEQHAGRLVHCKTSSDLAKPTQKTCKVILSIEGASAFCGSVQRIHELYDLGVRLVSLTWNGSNELGCGIREERDTGLSEFGRQAVKTMLELPMIIDVSHLSDRGFWQVAELAYRPFIASHSNARSVCGDRRNLTDAQLKELVARGGIAGINLYTRFLNGKRDAAVSDVFPHIERFLELGGENAVCLGSDFDGADVPRDLRDISALPVLAEYLYKKNYSGELIDKIFFKNAYDFFVKNL